MLRDLRELWGKMDVEERMEEAEKAQAAASSVNSASTWCMLT